jgi:hypothetical protein
MDIFQIMRNIGMAIIISAIRQSQKGDESAKAFLESGGFSEICRVYGVPASVAKRLREKMAAGSKVYISLKRGNSS